jgi:hypothetical protein
MTPELTVGCATADDVPGTATLIDCSCRFSPLAVDYMAVKKLVLICHRNLESMARLTIDGVVVVVDFASWTISPFPRLTS